MPERPNNIIDAIKKGKAALSASRKMMESGLDEERPSKPNPAPKQEMDMTDEGMKKRDEEYRRKGWIK